MKLPAVNLTAPILFIGLGLATLAAGYWMGRAHRATDRMIVTDTTESIQWLRRQDTQVLHVEHKITAWRTKIIEHPDGKKETETETREEKDSRTGTSTRTEESSSQEAKSQTRIVQSSTPRLMLGAFASINRNGPGYGPLLSLRLVGPVWAAAAYEVRSKTGTLSLGVFF